MNMIKFIKMKKNELKVKSMLYGTIVSLIDDRKDILELIQKLYTALKSVPAEELRSELINRLAEMIHEGNENASE